MAKYIFNTEAEADQYNDVCVIAHGHSGSTARWANVQKHPTLEKYAIDKGSVIVKNAELVQELSTDWFNNELDV